MDLSKVKNACPITYEGIYAEAVRALWEFHALIEAACQKSDAAMFIWFTSNASHKSSTDSKWLFIYLYVAVWDESSAINDEKSSYSLIEPQNAW